jgi:hypothetical protein
MWLSLVRKTEWSSFLELVSPSFFDVLPAGVLSRQAKVLLANSLARARFSHARQRCQQLLERSGAPVLLAPPGAQARAVQTLSEPERRAHGGRVLQLFFLQVLGAPEALLDVRVERFWVERAGSSTWWPAPVFITWEPDFLAALRALYLGFYGGEEARLRQGLRALHLEAAEDIFREHFGGDARAVRFSLQHFQHTFHAAFVRCREAGRQLHGNFLPLGLFLACLYEHLEQLAVPLDVRAAFQAALPHRAP